MPNLGKFLVFGLVCSLFGSGDAAPKIKNQRPSLIAQNEVVYILVVDAGSTGSRVVAYKFLKTGDKLNLLEEKFHKTRPGLSAFAHNVTLGAKNITDLVDGVKDFVPENLKNKTKIYLRATAGLRLLGEEKANQLLNAVKNAFKKKKEYEVPEDTAAMLSGDEEGLFAWFTVNFFKHSLKKHRTYATIEMGGGSAQVTYEVNHPYRRLNQKYIRSSPKDDISVFTHSYLGLGLSAARQGILQLDHLTSELQNNSVISSTCYNELNSPQSFTFNNMKLTVKGRPRKNHRYGINIRECRQRVLKFVRNKIQPVPYGLFEEANVALSAFYYRGKSGNVITDAFGYTTIGKLWRKMIFACKSADNNDPFLCMDLLYMHTLLTRGFGLGRWNVIEMLNNIEKHELSWALGFAYSKIMKPKDNEVITYPEIKKKQDFTKHPTK